MQLHTKNFIMSLISINFVNCFIDTNIIKAYFKTKSIKYATIIGCFKKHEQLGLAKMFMYEQERLSLFNIDEPKIEISLKTAHEQIAVVVDGDCKNVTVFLEKCGKAKLFSVHHHWLVLSSSDDNINELFKSVIININADIQIVSPDKVQGGGSHISRHYTIKDVYNPAFEHGGVLQHYNLGYYNKTNGYQARTNQCKYWLRKNMTQVTFRTIVVLPVPFEGTLTDYLNSDDDREINTFNRFHNRLMGFCRDYYNYTMKIKVLKSWGYKINDTSFDGLVGELERKTADFGLSPLFVREDRAKVMEYGRRTWILRAAFIFRNPKMGTSVEIFLKPLSLSIWLLTILLATIVVMTLKLSLTYERHHLHNNNVDTSWSYLVISTIGAFCQQGTTSTPTLLCGRIAMIFLFLLSVIIYQFYSASIVSSLLQKPTTVIQTIEQILHSTMKAGCEDVLYNRDYFLYTTDKPSKELFYQKISGKRNNPNFLSPFDGLALVEKGNYAFHVELATAYPIIRETYGDKAICELREVQMYRTQPMHANLQKHSPFRDMVDTCLQRLAEHGLLFREIEHWHPRKPECIQSSKSVVFNVGLDDFYPALMALGIGIICSLILLAVEQYIYSKTKTKFVKTKFILYPFVK